MASPRSISVRSDWTASRVSRTHRPISTPASSMQIGGIDHVQITIPTGAEGEARAFYCDLLGLPEIPKPETLAGRGGFWLRVGSMTLHVGTEPEWDRSVTKAHVAFVVDDVHIWRERIEAAGYETQ